MGGRGVLRLRGRPLSMGFSRRELWSGLPVPSLGDLPNPEIEPMSPTSQADSLPAEPRGKPPYWGMIVYYLIQFIVAQIHHS